MWNVYFYVPMLKVITKVKQNLKLEKEIKIVEEVRKILCLTARFDCLPCTHLVTHKDHRASSQALLLFLTLPEPKKSLTLSVPC